MLQGINWQKDSPVSMCTRHCFGCNIAMGPNIPRWIEYCKYIYIYMSALYIFAVYV